jgi:hypothetical protein
MAKSFKKAPKPKQPTEAEIAAFERGGAGHDQAPSGPTKRLSIDVPEDLHAQFKAMCALTKRKMQTEVIAFIERRVDELGSEAGLK